MKKTILLILTMFLLTGTVSVGEVATAEQKVYICTGKYSKRYHKNTKCRGMKACKGDIVQVSLSEAKKEGKTACGYCY